MPQGDAGTVDASCTWGAVGGEKQSTFLGGGTPPCVPNASASARTFPSLPELGREGNVTFGGSGHWRGSHAPLTL